MGMTVNLLKVKLDQNKFITANIYSVVYYIVITCDDNERIAQLRQHLISHFQTKDLGKLKVLPRP